MKLPISLVPEPLWGQSLAGLLPRNKWGAIREQELDRAGNKCEVCDYQGKGLICHEVWDYDDERHVASLKGFQIVCRQCDMVHHMGRAGVIGRGDEAIQLFMRINKLTPTKAKREKRKAFEIWKERSRHDWAIDWGAHEKDIQANI